MSKQIESRAGTGRPLFRRSFLCVWLLCVNALIACSTTGAPEITKKDRKKMANTEVLATNNINKQPRLALALGGGAAKGFAHIGVLKVLQSHGIVPDLVTGTSVGSFAGALYSSGLDPFDMQEMALDFNASDVRDMTISREGFIKGEKLQQFVNRAVKQQPIQSFPIAFAAVATELSSGKKVVFSRGDAGFAVRASSSVPNIFIPAQRDGKRYLDGGLVSPVPVSIARELGAKIVIAVDISDRPKVRDNVNILNIIDQTFNIISKSELDRELAAADVVIKPDVLNLDTMNIDNKHAFILEGERAAQRQIAAIKKLLAAQDKQ